MKTQWGISVTIRDENGRVLEGYSEVEQTEIDPDRITLNDKDVLQAICDAGHVSLRRLLKGRS